MAVPVVGWCRSAAARAGVSGGCIPPPGGMRPRQGLQRVRWLAASLAAPARARRARPTRAPAHARAGAILPYDTPVNGLAHELGHALELEHSYSNDGYKVGLGWGWCLCVCVWGGGGGGGGGRRTQRTGGTRGAHAALGARGCTRGGWPQRWNGQPACPAGPGLLCRPRADEIKHLTPCAPPRRTPRPGRRWESTEICGTL